MVRKPAKQQRSKQRGQDVGWNIVNRGDWLWSPANIKGASKDAKIYVGRSTTRHNLLFSPHTLCMSFVTNTFLLVSSSVRSKQLLRLVQGQGQKTEQEHTTKNFDEFHNHSPLLTMVIIKMCKFNMFITAVCVLFLIKLRWPKNKSIYETSLVARGKINKWIRF